ncbi:protein NLRC5-like isoform X2 [Salvelinus alpinus]|uniref:protein NLRC5-like isoform X2 n=1 Tax=Salvelinus alpinus TaxID=8036 RepID=UPI0039FD51B8
MASTRQSALEYITNGRLLLIGRLQNLPLIVENLFQRKVLHEEEVSKIQAEVDFFDQTRRILDWVSDKGEAACYELLTILDITRKRTLGDADLQQWISYFPFKEDTEMTDYFVGSKPCHGYQKQLKCKARRITECAWKQNCGLLPERLRNEGTFSYTPLVLDTYVDSFDSKIKVKSKRCKKARPKKLKSFIPMAKQETSPAELLKTHEKILLVGKPGIGKTTVAHQMLNLWAEKDHRELDYMFYFDMRDISHREPMSLEDLLFNMYSEPKESKEEVLQDIKKNSENVVIIFDAITDLSSLAVVKDLVENLLPDAKIVTTCRPDQSEDFLTDWPTDWFRVEVKGFSDESIRAYLTQMLSAEPDYLSSVLNNLELFSLCHVPIYALMVVACSYYSTLADSKQPCSTTKMYINILRHCIQKHSAKRMKDHDKCLIKNREKILSLAEIAFDATNEKNMNLTTLSCEESSVHFAFLGALMVKISPTASDTYSAFLHYTMQEFFGALWLLQNPDKIREVVEKCQTEEWKHTKHLIPFLCGLLNERNIRLVNSLVPAQQIKKTSDWFFKEMVNTFLPSQTNQDHAEGGAPESDKDLLFLCQCLYEYQSTEVCQLLLYKLDYHLDLSGEHLDPHQCCAVSYVTSQSAERKVGLDLNGCTVSDQGVRLILGSLKNVRHLGPSSDDSSDPSMLCQLWTTLLRSEAEMDFTSLLGLCGNELRLPVHCERRVFEKAEEVMKQSLEMVHLCLHWDQRTVLSEALSKTILKCLPNINKLRFTPLQHQRGSPEKLETEEKAVLLNLCLQGALDHRYTVQRTVNTLLSLFSVYQTERYDILLDLYSHVKYNRNQTARSVLPSLKPLYQPAPAVWSIDLSERKASLLLEVLKLQPEKKPVELKGWSDEESEVRSFLQCLPYISQLSFTPPQDQRRCPKERTRRERTFLLNLCLQIALHERGTIQTTVEKVLSLSEVYHYQKCGFLLDLYSHVKDYETQGRSVLPALQLVYKSASPAVWSLDLSDKKASLLLEVLKLQPEKKPVELWGWSDEESEVRSFLQCLSYISQLRLNVGMAVKLSRLVMRTERGATPLTVPELSLVLKSSQAPERVLSRALSSVASLLRLWRVQCLDLTDLCIQGHSLITLLCHQGSLSLRLNSDTLQQLTVVVYEAQDKDLTQWFLEKVGGDLTSCRLDWEVLLSLLQHSTHNITVDLRKNRLLEKNISDLLPFLGRITLKSPSKALLLQLLDLVCEGIEEGLLRHTESLCRALDGELDLSETKLDQKACGSLALVLEHSEGLSELDLSHCQLTDHHLQPLITHLHKVQVLDLSHNDITDALTDRILQLVSTNTSIHTVRLFNNRIQDRRPFLTDKRFDIW